MNEIKVNVVEFGDRKHYQMQFRDPMTGRKKTRSTGVERTGRKRDRDAAVAAAGVWEAELREGRYQSASRTTWQDFRERYTQEKLASLANRTAEKADEVLDAVERIINPMKLADLSTARVSAFQAKLRERGLSESTIKGYSAYLGAALNWAKRMGLLAVVPNIESPRRAKGGKVMKGRPISGEEFDRMLAKVESVVGAQAAPSWRHYMTGLWLSGLRLSESLELTWDRDDKLCVDLSGKRPMLRIPAELEKGFKDRVLAIAPEFAEFLASTPEAERTGHVFKPMSRRPDCPRLLAHHVGKIVTSIGKAAGVKVNTATTTGKVKYASAHDLRRSFGERWASRVMPQVLMELMRHESIETTMKFYVGRNAQATADVLWAAHSAQAANEITPAAAFAPVLPT